MRPVGVNRLRLDPDKTTIYRGHHVVVADRHGLMAGNGEGYYLQQTRFLSRFQIASGGVLLEAVSCNSVEPHSTVAYYLMPSPAGRKAAPPGDADPSGGEVVAKGIEIQINTYAGGGYHQDVHVTNHALAEAAVILDWAYDADFADLDEVGSGERRQDAPIRRVFEARGRGQGELTFVYQHPRINHAARIRIACAGDVTDQGASIRTALALGPRQTERISVDLAPVFLGEPVEPWFGLDGAPTGRFPGPEACEDWLAGCAGFTASNATVQAAWNRAATDSLVAAVAARRGGRGVHPDGGRSEIYRLVRPRRADRRPAIHLVESDDPARSAPVGRRVDRDREGRSLRRATRESAASAAAEPARARGRDAVPPLLRRLFRARAVYSGRGGGFRA